MFLLKYGGGGGFFRALNAFLLYFNGFFLKKKTIFAKQSHPFSNEAIQLPDLLHQLKLSSPTKTPNSIGRELLCHGYIYRDTMPTVGSMGSTCAPLI